MSEAIRRNNPIDTEITIDVKNLDLSEDQIKGKTLNKLIRNSCDINSASDDQRHSIAEKSLKN
jgi:hypothetical protein